MQLALRASLVLVLLQACGGSNGEGGVGGAGAEGVVFSSTPRTPAPPFDAEEPAELVVGNLVHLAAVEFLSTGGSGPCNVDGAAESEPFAVRMVDSNGAPYVGRATIELEPLLKGARAFLAVDGKCADRADFKQWPGRVAGSVSLAEPPLNRERDTSGPVFVRVTIKVPGNDPIEIVPGQSVKSERRDTTSMGSSPDAPASGVDHWHAAYSVYVCGRHLPASDEERDPVGIHSHRDGLIHIHPFSKESSGRKATIGVFFQTLGEELTDSAFSWGGKTWSEGRDTCSGKAAQVVVQSGSTRITKSASATRLRDCSWVTIAFVPQGTDVPSPPQFEAKLRNAADLPPGSNACDDG